jgi:hypothetical protein
VGARVGFKTVNRPKEGRERGELKPNRIKRTLRLEGGADSPAQEDDLTAPCYHAPTGYAYYQLVSLPL